MRTNKKCIFAASMLLGWGVLILMALPCFLGTQRSAAAAAVTASPAQTAAVSASPVTSAPATSSAVRSPEPAMSVMDAPIEQKITRKGLIYEYTGTHAHLIGCTSVAKNKKKIKIPAKICVQDIYYDVTMIDCGALQGCSKLRRVSVGKYVRQIRYGAFLGDQKLKRVVFRGKKLRNVGERAFRNTAPKIRFVMPSSVYSRYRTLLQSSGADRPVYRAKS